MKRSGVTSKQSSSCSQEGWPLSPRTCHESHPRATDHPAPPRGRACGVAGPRSGDGPRWRRVLPEPHTPGWGLGS